MQKNTKQKRKEHNMNETQMKEHLDWALDAIDDGDMATAIDHINQVKDHLEQKEDEANEAIMEAVHG